MQRSIYNCRRVLQALFVIFLLQTQILLAQTVVKGNVSDSSGIPLAGVSISVKGTNNGTSTNEQGDFSLAANPGAILIFSYVGFETKELRATEGTLMVVLGSSNLVSTENVVVTALGIRKDKRILGFATQEIKGDALIKAREPQVISGLTGRVAGLTITNKSSLFEDAQITLRGKTPLIVIDGVPSQGDMWNLNPDDIESINVLKSNAAALLYGAVGVNGALQITTKKGKSGSNGVEASVNQSFQMSGGWLKLPEYQTEYGMGWNGWYAFTNGRGGGGWYDNYGYVWGPKLNQRDPNSESGWLEIPQYNSPYDPNTQYTFTQRGASGTSNYKPIPWISRGTNNLANFMQNQLLYTINANIAGRSDNGGYRISMSHMYQRGQIPNTKLNSSTISMAGDLKLSQKLKVEANLSYNRQFSPNYPSNAYGPDNFFYNLLLWMGADVDVRDMKNYWKPGRENLEQLTYNYAWYNNPYYMAQERLRDYKNDVIVASANLNYNIGSGLNFMVRSGGTFHHKEQSLSTPYSFIYYSARPFGDYSQSAEHRFLLQNDAILTYKKKMGDFDVSVAGGAANRYERYSANGGSVTGGLLVPNVYNLAMSRDPATAWNSKWEKETNSLFGYTDIGYKNYLNLNISVRNDWTSTLQKPYNSFLFPSTSLSFILSEVVKMPEIISFVKLRGAYADVRSEVAPYYTLPIYQEGTRWNGTPSLSLPGTIFDPAIRPNRTVSREVGIETMFLKNRIGIDATYYSYLDKDSPRDIPQSGASGFPTFRVNGDVYNRTGLELVLTAAPIQKKNFGWDVLLNYSRIRNHVKELYGNVESRGLVRVGDRINVDPNRWGALQYTGWKWERSPEGDIVYNQNGMPKYINQVMNLGVHEHDWDFGINNSFRYKRFSFSFLFDGRIGGNVYNGVESKMYESGAHKATANQYRDDSYEGRATYVGQGVVVTSGEILFDAFGNVTSDTRKFAPNTKAVKYVDWVFNKYTTGVTDALLYRQTFVKVREIVIGYNFNPAILKRLKITSASVSVVGRNLFMFTKVPFMDPEAYSGLTMAEPTYRNLGLNLNLKF